MASDTLIKKRLASVLHVWDRIESAHHPADTQAELAIALDSFADACTTARLPSARGMTIRILKLLEDNGISSISRPHFADIERLINRGEPVDKMAFDGPKYIAVLGEDANSTDEMTSQLDHYGFNTLRVDAMSDLAAVISKKRPFSAVIKVDDAFFTSIAASRMTESGMKWVAIADHDDFSMRVRASRMGCVAFFTLPCHSGQIADAVELILHPRRIETSCRVAVIDNAEGVGSEYEDPLSGADMAVTVIKETECIISGLKSCKPDIILINISRGEYTDEEVTRVIRQNEMFLSIPIIHLSDGDNLDAKLEVMRSGGDDYLPRAIDPEHLATAILHTAERYRMLRRFMVQDSLTGLANHTRIKQQLDDEVLAASVSGRPVTFAMVDIDFFKKVNDTYGHPAGDLVIKSMARLLRQKLRKTDYVGRYGGEEFAVILPGATGADAVAVLDRIRADFGAIYHYHETGIFSATFSCGVTEFNLGDKSSEMGCRADEALYTAKRSGRNRVVLWNNDADEVNS